MGLCVFQESAESLNMALNENIKLKREIDSLKNELDALAAELNSVKIITQYHSDSESDLSRSLNPLKVSSANFVIFFLNLKFRY